MACTRVPGATQYCTEAAEAHARIAELEAERAVQDIDAMLERGVAVLRASGRLRYEADGADQALVLAIVDAVMGGRE